MMGLNGLDVKPAGGIRCSRTKTASASTQAGRQANQRPAIAPVLAVGLLIASTPLVDEPGPVATPAAREFTEPCRLWKTVSIPMQSPHPPLQGLHRPLQKLHTEPVFLNQAIESSCAVLKKVDQTARSRGKVSASRKTR